MPTRLGCKVTVLADNYVSAQGLCAEAGLSLLVETGEGRVVLDTGQGIAIGSNLWELFPGLDRLDALVLSHGHYDHTGGIGALLSFLGLSLDITDAPAAYPKVYVHPEIELPKYAKDRENYRSIGLTEGLDTYFPANAILKTREPVEVLPGAFFMGELPREHPAPYPKDRFFRLDPETKAVAPDPLFDDTCLVLDAEGGLIVLTGCNHSGLPNLVLGLKARFGDRPVKALIGGLHLSGADQDYMSASLDALRKLNPETVIPLHCSGIKGYEAIKETLGTDRAHFGCTGASYAFA